MLLLKQLCLSGNGKNIPIKFTDLYQHLKQKNCYEPVDLTEFIGEYESRDARYLFIKDLSKNGLGDISFELLRYSPGGSVRTLAAVWKIPNDGFNRKRSDEVAGALREAMPIFLVTLNLSLPYASLTKVDQRSTTNFGVNLGIILKSMLQPKKGVMVTLGTCQWLVVFLT